MRRHEYPAGFPVRLALKDLQLISEVRQGSQATMPLLNAALERFTSASQDLANKDLAAIYELEQLRVPLRDHDAEVNIHHRAWPVPSLLAPSRVRNDLPTNRLITGKLCSN
jgi:NAD-binding of NADP-dependent 3-hydroxyisobutyrate dehydrogenase